MNSTPVTESDFAAALEAANTASSYELILTRGGRTGKKAHLAATDSSSTRCGHWTKFQMRNFKVSPYTASTLTACSKCFA